MKERKLKKLSPRLEKIAEFIRNDTTVCDVGTDHAFLPCYLARKGVNPLIYATDINPKPLERAETEVAHKGVDVILLQSDGLEKVPPCEDVVIAGMGGELIAEIVANMPERFKTPELRLILQPMTKADVLRQELKDLQFEIIREEKVLEAKQGPQGEICRSSGLPLMKSPTKIKEYVILYVQCKANL
ncbi:MAG: class I SAM-dependent methyltransferase [Oscillospiraceae bacterium]|nr:class I SAM-dependent methyltransferase [Oscillospiraceae bacterium]